MNKILQKKLWGDIKSCTFAVNNKKNMKRKYFILTIAILSMLSVGVTNVWADGGGSVPFIILPPGGDDGGGDDPLPGGPGNGGGGEDPLPKSPVQMPTIVQDGYTLYIISGCTGATLILRDEYETEVYSTQITDETDEITLPSTLSGTYEIRLIRGSLTFAGEIEL